MDTVTLTYRELADRLGVKLASARKTVQRKRWQRIAGNDGTVRINVPIEALPVPQDVPEDVTPDSGPDPILFARLEIEIAGLKELVTAERARADAEAARANTEGKRANDAIHDRDAWRLMAQRPWWRRMTG